MGKHNYTLKKRGGMNEREKTKKAKVEADKAKKAKVEAEKAEKEKETLMSQRFAAQKAAQSAAHEVARNARAYKPLSSPEINDMILKIHNVNVDNYKDMLNALPISEYKIDTINSLSLNIMHNDTETVIKKCIYIINEIVSLNKLTNINTILNKKSPLLNPIPIKTIDINTILEVKAADFENEFINVSDNNCKFTIANIITVEKISNLKNYIKILYKYNKTVEIDKIILLYCSYVILIQYLESNKPKLKPVVKYETANHNLKNEELFFKAVKNILTANLQNNMMHYFNKFIQDLHNNLIFHFSPYNIIDNHLKTFKSYGFLTIKNNIFIMQLCIFLYGTHNYTELELKILRFNNEVKISASNPTFKFNIKDRNEPNPTKYSVEQYRSIIMDITVQRQNKPKPPPFKDNIILPEDIDTFTIPTKGGTPDEINTTNFIMPLHKYMIRVLFKIPPNSRFEQTSPIITKYTDYFNPKGIIFTEKDRLKTTIKDIYKID